ncbi:hypothetical protein Trydic_g20057 [Trypoxylus dichotomus]
MMVVRSVGIRFLVFRTQRLPSKPSLTASSALAAGIPPLVRLDGLHWKKRRDKRVARNKEYRRDEPRSVPPTAPPFFVTLVFHLQITDIHLRAPDYFPQINETEAGAVNERRR